MGRKIIDVTGQKYNSLTPLKLIGVDEWRGALYECQCDCGNMTVASTSELRSGAKKTCGCSRNKPRKPKAESCVVCGAPKIKAKNMCSKCYMEWWNEKRRKEMERYL